MTLVVNLAAGPGAGKSTMAAGLFHELKKRGVKCELVTEYAKDMYYDGRLSALNKYSQTYLFAKQHHRVFRLLDEVDVLITDSPLFLCLFYGPKYSGDEWNRGLHEHIMHEHKRLDTLNFFVNRMKPYQKYGRGQTEEEAKIFDLHIRKIMEHEGIEFITVDGNSTGLQHAFDRIMDELNE